MNLLSVQKRDTKCGTVPYGNWGSRKYMLSSLDDSLRRMGLDYVDIFYHHRMDPATPLEESMLALDTAVKQGKALYAGISNYDAKTTKRAMEILKELRCPFIINQVRYSIFDLWIVQERIENICGGKRLWINCFQPAGTGLLTDKYLHGIPENSRIKKDADF